MQPTKDGPRVNEDIKARSICVVDAEGNMSDPMTVREGVEMAAEVGLDLVEVAPNAEPPVCKLIDYGKFKYEQSKKQNEAKKKQKVIEVKEIKLRPNIDTGFNVLSKSSAAAGLGTLNKRSYKRTSAVTDSGADTQWITPFTLRPSLGFLPNVSGS